MILIVYICNLKLIEAAVSKLNICYVNILLTIKYYYIFYSAKVLIF